MQVQTPSFAARRAPFDVVTGEEFVDEQVENHQHEDGSWGNSTWFSHRKPELKQLNPLINLPFVIDGDVVQHSPPPQEISTPLHLISALQQVVTQSNACLAYLGRKFNMYGTTPLESVRCDELLCEVHAPPPPRTITLTNRNIR